MREPRRQRPTRWNYPETYTYTPSGSDDRRYHQLPQSPIAVVVALIAACIGVFFLTKAADIHPATHANDRDVTTAVHKELQKMFLADLPSKSHAIRSGVISAGTPERINYPQEVLALRCYGTGSIAVTKILMDGTNKTRSDIRCGGTGLTLITNDIDVRAVLVTPKGANTWASWALTRPSVPASDV
ncbi:hypothetical protein ACIG53_13655 [Streptomyces bauhiniae]|uniref:hypothetical protein n=1 Tax=Streptomyces bauhiniae TaxID=2340725 RepID=UPI0037D0DD9A